MSKHEDQFILGGSFDKIFKDSIRDYYAYGVKSFDQFSKSRKSIENNWKRYNDLLKVKWNTEKRKKGRNYITLKPMQIGDTNPLDDLYFLHQLSYFGDYLNYLLDLDSRSSVNREKIENNFREFLENVRTLDGEKELMDINFVESNIITNWLYGKENDKEDIVRINRQLYIWSLSTRDNGIIDPTDLFKNLNERTKVLYGLGILGDLRDDQKKLKNWKEKQFELQNQDYRNCIEKNNNSSKGNHFWFKSPLTIQNLKLENKLLEKVMLMCAFFSNYYPLGEIGTMILRRCKSKCNPNGNDVFVFKHNYIQKSLYDYNLIDLLVAIENESLCKVCYSHAFNSYSFEEIIVPLEIRVSVTNGREYVLYYSIQNNRIKALRIEFLDNIKIIERKRNGNKIKVIKSLKFGKEICNKEIYFDLTKIKNQIIKAKEMLPYIWGVDLGKCEVDECWKKRLHTFTMSISYDKEREKYIENRLRKERRVNSETITIFPTKELRSWIRSFYMRIDSISETSNEGITNEGFNIEGFDIEDDVKTMWKLYYENNDPYEDVSEKNSNNKSNIFATIKYEVSGKNPYTNTYDGHEGLFNELISEKAIVLANSLLNSNGEEFKYEERFLRENLENSIKENLKYCKEDTIKELVDKAVEYLSYYELIDSNDVRFKLAKCDYLFDILPLTKVEARWLLAVLDDPLADIFLEGDEKKHLIEKITAFAPFEVKKYEMNHIKYFDKYQMEKRSDGNKTNVSLKEELTGEEEEFLKKIIEAMKSHHKILITYSTWNGEIKKAKCSPVWIEYSLRDDAFRVWDTPAKGFNRAINLSRIIGIKEINIEYDLSAQRNYFNKNKELKSIKISFYHGNKNLPDRILTEFSLWEKVCSFDELTNIYTLELKYFQSDEKEILLRLLKYGPYIKVEDDNNDNYILDEIKKRVEKQKDKIITRGFERD